MEPNKTPTPNQTPIKRPMRPKTETEVDEDKSEKKSTKTPQWKSKDSPLSRKNEKKDAREDFLPLDVDSGEKTKSALSDSGDEKIESRPCIMIPHPGSNEHPSVFSAMNASKIFKQDIDETVVSLKNFGINPKELLSLVETCLTKVFREFLDNSERMKEFMGRKWKAGGLKGQFADAGLRQKSLLKCIISLEKWKRESHAVSVAFLESLWKEENPSELTKVDSKLMQEGLDRYCSSLIEILEYGQEIACYSAEGTSKAITILDKQAEEITTFINKIQDLNKKSVFTIVIIGLEKAGKTTFINALLGAEVLPTAETRCTQVMTVIAKTEHREFATIELYTKAEFEKNMNDATNNGVPAEQIKKIRLVCKDLIGESDKKIESIHGEKTFHDEIRKYVATDELMFVVKKVTIYTNKLDSNICWEICDTPGIDSVINEHRVAVSKAISQADAFIILTSGQKPSLTRDQTGLLNEILAQHYDAMSHAFAGVTWLDTLNLEEVSLKHFESAKADLLKLGFIEQNIFPVNSKKVLLKAKLEKGLATDSDIRELEVMSEKNFAHLKDGFEDLEYAIGYCVKHDLPHRRAKSAIDIAQKKLLPLANSFIQLGRSYIPEYIGEERQLDGEIETANNEKWNKIFLRSRLEPTIQKALSWKKEFLTFELAAQNENLLQFFVNAFEKSRARSCMEDIQLEKLMLSHVLNANGSAMSHRVSEDIEREKRVTVFEGIILEVGLAVAHYLFSTYIVEFIHILNTICPEEPSLFMPSITETEFSFEVLALIKRVSLPLIRACLRWAHDNQEPRELAAKELVAVVPWESLGLCNMNDNTGMPNLTKLIASTLGFLTKDNLDGTKSLPDDVKKIMDKLFNSNKKNNDSS